MRWRDGEFRVADVPLELALSAKVLYVGGYLLMPNFEQDALWTCSELCAGRA